MTKAWLRLIGYALGVLFALLGVFLGAATYWTFARSGLLPLGLMFAAMFVGIGVVHGVRFVREAGRGQR